MNKSKLKVWEADSDNGDGRSTETLYSQYMGFVLGVHGFCTLSTRALYCWRTAWRVVLPAVAAGARAGGLFAMSVLHFRLVGGQRSSV